MVHGGLLGLRIFFHIIISKNLNVEWKDRCKAGSNASKKLYHANPILGNIDALPSSLIDSNMNMK
jgi:hypothetical protein